MIWIDWLFILLVVYNLGSGLITGLMRSLINLAALITAYLLTPIVKIPVIQLVQNLFDLPLTLALPVGTVLSWTGVYVLISAMGIVVAKTMDKTPVKILDRLGGALFGCLISALMIFVPLMAVRALPFLKKIPALERTLNESHLIPILNPILTRLENSLGPIILDYWVKTTEQNKLQSETAPKPGSTSKPGIKPATPSGQP